MTSAMRLSACAVPQPRKVATISGRRYRKATIAVRAAIPSGCRGIGWMHPSGSNGYLHMDDGSQFDLRHSCRIAYFHGEFVRPDIARIRFVRGQKADPAIAGATKGAMTWPLHDAVAS